MNKVQFKDTLKDSSRYTNQEIYTLLSDLVKHLKDSYKPTKEDLINIYSEAEIIKIPVSVFSYLSPLESLVKYLKENCSMRFIDIARKLGRDSRSIWMTYRNACAKHPKLFSVKNDFLSVPIDVFLNDKLSILESLSVYLKDELSISVTEISVFTKKSVSTIWTAYNRAKKKLKK